MLSYHFLLDLAFILISTKLLGLLTRRIQMPQVVGALLSGLILGPAILNIVHETDFIKQVAEIGVIVLMFSAGLETDIKELVKCGKASLVVAIFGVLLPLGGGFLVAAIFNNGSLVGLDTKSLLESIFIGVILTATSVSITVETLQELGKLQTRVGTIILGAALIDDILGILVLTVITSVATASSNVWIVLLKIIGFFIFAALTGIPFNFIFNKYSNKLGQKRRFPIIAFSFCLALAYLAEHFFGVADIAGAFVAGLVLSTTHHAKYIWRRFEIVSYLFLSPIFFASIGINVRLDTMSTKLVVFSLVLLVIAILTKILGCGLGALLTGSSKKESLQIGVGMIARGEVALIVANIGLAAGLLRDLFFAPVILVVIVTTIITPIVLKMTYGRNQVQNTLLQQNQK